MKFRAEIADERFRATPQSPRDPSKGGFEEELQKQFTEWWAET